MKVCLLNVIHEPFDKRVFQKVARSLVEAGHEVVSICPLTAAQEEERTDAEQLAAKTMCKAPLSQANRALRPGSAPGALPATCESDTKISIPQKTHGVAFIAIPEVHTKWDRIKSIWHLLREGNRVDAEVYCAPEPESWVAALLLKLVRPRRKVVFDMHEHFAAKFGKYFPPFLERLMFWLTIRFMRLFARFTDHILLTRESFEPMWAGLKTPRSIVINTNHLQPVCAHVPAPLLERYAGRPTLLHQGLFGDVRGSWQLLDAMKLLAPEVPGLRCILLGEYKYGSEADYRRAVNEAGLDNCIDFAGVVPYDAVPPYIAVADIGLILFQPGLLNHTLAMPHKLFDYMREGKPTIAPDFAVEVAHIVRETDCGLLVDVTDPSAIADAILRLLRDPAEARRLGANGRRAVETTYNWQADEARLLKAFKALE